MTPNSVNNNILDVKPILGGLKKNVTPFNLKDDEFEKLEDCYQRIDHIKKRVGTNLVRGTPEASQFRAKSGETSDEGSFSGTMPGKIFKVGQTFLVGNATLTVLEEGQNKPLGTNSQTITGTFSTTDGSLTITGSEGKNDIYFYPCEPCMGIYIRELPSINSEQTLWWDTQFCYYIGEKGFERLGSDENSIWTGNDSQFFWAVNFRSNEVYKKAIYVVNNNPNDNIRYIEEDATEWKRLIPDLNRGGTSRKLLTAKIIFVFQNYLCVANTIENEGGQNRYYYNRVRRAQKGKPTDSKNSWVDNVAGQGGFLTVNLQQQITCVSRSYNILVLGLERGARIIRSTGLPDEPMAIDEISNNTGIESGWSIVQNRFNGKCVGIGVDQINEITPQFNGVNRIDTDIPDDIRSIRNCCQSVERVHGIFDPHARLIYWTIPIEFEDSKFPNRLLVYNYVNRNFSYWYDSFTAFGYYQEQNEMTWDTVGDTFSTWDAWVENWDTTRQKQYWETVCANQQGFAFVLNRELTTNAISLRITDVDEDIITCINYNLPLGSYIRLEDETANYNVIVQVIEKIDDDTFRVDYKNCSPDFSKAKYIRRISSPVVKSKEWTVGTPMEQSARIAHIHFLLKTTDFAKHIIDYYRNGSQDISVHQTQNESDDFIGNRVIRSCPEEGKEYDRKNRYIWHKFSRQVNGNHLSWQISHSDEQMRDWSIVSADFALYRFLIKFDTAGKLL